MVDQTQRLSRYRELIQELNETKKMEIARRTVELFFSFDIVNSSLYKTINYTGWYNVIISLFTSKRNETYARCRDVESFRG